MSPIRLRSALPAFTLLAALLVAPALVQARPAQPDRQAARASSSFFGNLWSFLTRMWGAEGVSIDPWGGGSKPSAGGSIDPWGGHGQPV